MGEGGCDFLLSPKDRAQNSLRLGRAKGPGGMGDQLVTWDHSNQILFGQECHKWWTPPEHLGSGQALGEGEGPASWIFLDIPSSGLCPHAPSSMLSVSSPGDLRLEDVRACQPAPRGPQAPEQSRGRCCVPVSQIREPRL